jgi:hypothetical protein
VVTKFGDRYELIRLIGAGGMGEVWLAHDEELAGRPVAIKIMHRHMLPNADDVARFEREMRFAAMMDHPNIVTVYTTGTWEQAPFMVMEYLRGQDLEQAPPGGDAGHIARIGQDVCNGLAYAHGAGVIHRDIKPANLFRCESGQVKITDFGVARAVDAAALSTIGVVVGTLAYVPPERWRGEPPAFSNDIWAVGCVLYRLIAGRLPRLLPDVAYYAAAAIAGDPFPDLRDITDAPGWLTGLVMAMLDNDPVLRPTAGECARLLSSRQAPAPAPGRLARSLRRTGRLGSGQLGSGQTDPGPVGGAPGEGPETSLVTRPDTARPATARSRRAGRAALAAAALLAALLAGSITAWRLSGMPSGRPAAASGTVMTSSPTGPAAGPASPPGSAAARATPRPTAPASYRPALPASPPAGPAPGSPSAPPAHSPTASAPARPSAPPAPSTSAPASSTPHLVPVPDVVGMTFLQARQLLISDGFTVLGRHTRRGQMVTRTNPPAGEVPAGSLIIVVYGTGTLLLRAAARLPYPCPRPARSYRPSLIPRR